MKKKSTILLLCTLLAGCTNIQAQRQQQASLNYCSTLSPWVVEAECLDQVAKHDITGNYQNPGSQEIMAYNRALIAAVRMKKINNDQADYLSQQKLVEMNRRIAITNALQQPTIIQPIYILP
jgi:hypothetical protein